MYIIRVKTQNYVMIFPFFFKFFFKSTDRKHTKAEAGLAISRCKSQETTFTKKSRSLYRNSTETI